MARYLLLLLFYLFFIGISSAQVVGDSSAITQTDSLGVKDSTAIKDSLMNLQWADSVSKNL